MTEEYHLSQALVGDSPPPRPDFVEEVVAKARSAVEDEVLVQWLVEDGPGPRRGFLDDVVMRGLAGPTNDGHEELALALIEDGDPPREGFIAELMAKATSSDESLAQALLDTAPPRSDFLDDLIARASAEHSSQEDEQLAMALIADSPSSHEAFLAKVVSRAVESSPASSSSRNSMSNSGSAARGSNNVLTMTGQRSRRALARTVSAVAAVAAAVVGFVWISDIQSDGGSSSQHGPVSIDPLGELSQTPALESFEFGEEISSDDLPLEESSFLPEEVPASDLPLDSSETFEHGGPRMLQLMLRSEEPEVKPKSKSKKAKAEAKAKAEDVKRDISGEIRSRMGGLQACYERELRYNAALKGKMSFVMVVDEAGHVAKVRVVEDGLGAPSARDCMLEKLKNWRFSEQEERSEVTFSVSFTEA